MKWLMSRVNMISTSTPARIRPLSRPGDETQRLPKRSGLSRGHKKSFSSVGALRVTWGTESKRDAFYIVVGRLPRARDNIQPSDSRTR